MEDYCMCCGRELIPALDADPNGDMQPKCAQCQAEEEHDFDKEPRARFGRIGQRITDTAPLS